MLRCVFQYYNLMFPNGVMYDEPEIMNSLTNQLRNELAIDMYGPVLDVIDFVPNVCTLLHLAKLFFWRCSYKY